MKKKAQKGKETKEVGELDEEIKQLLEEVEEEERQLIKRRILLFRLTVLASVWFVIEFVVIVIICLPLLQDSQRQTSPTELNPDEPEFRELTVEEEKLVRMATQAVEDAVLGIKRDAIRLKRDLEENGEDLRKSPWDDVLKRLQVTLEAKPEPCNVTKVKSKLMAAISNETQPVVQKVMGGDWDKEYEETRTFKRKLQDYYNFWREGQEGLSSMLKRAKGVSSSAFEVNHTLYHFSQEIWKAPWYEFDYDS